MPIKATKSTAVVLRWKHGVPEKPVTAYVRVVRTRKRIGGGIVLGNLAAVKRGQTLRQVLGNFPASKEPVFVEIEYSEGISKTPSFRLSH